MECENFLKTKLVYQIRFYLLNINIQLFKLKPKNTGAIICVCEGVFQGSASPQWFRSHWSTGMSEISRNGGKCGGDRRLPSLS